FSASAPAKTVPRQQDSPQPGGEVKENGSLTEVSRGAIPIMLPNQDLTVTEATVLRWLKNIGDSLAPGEQIVEVETAKSVFSVESPARGILKVIHAREGSVVGMNQPLGEVEPA